VIMLAIVPMRRSPATAKGWLLFIFMVPWLGLLAYLTFGRASLPRWRQEKLNRLPDALRMVTTRLREHPNVFEPKLNAELSQAVTLAQSLGNMPILGGNAAELLADYHGSIDRLAADIETAQNHVHLLYYIFADDAAAGRVVAALTRAVKRGVHCRVLVDSFGSRSWLKSLRAKMATAGIAMHDVLPYGIFRRRSARRDLRNHRKLAVIDGRIGYTGSQNLVDPVFKPGLTYEEMVVRVTGPIVLELQYVFIGDWFLETEELLDRPELFPDPALTGMIPAQVLPSGPGFVTENNQRLIVALIHGARRRVVITTPYFIPDEALLQALQTAAMRGVEVHLVCSQKYDQLLVGLAQSSYYEELLEEGIQIHLYEKNFLHAKHMSVDDHISLIGSSNMDIRSFALNAEISLLFYDAEVNRQLRIHQERYFKNCERLTVEKWEQRYYLSRFCQNLARLMSPLL
jgi:cardiolipin synthase